MPSKTLVINCGASHVAAAVFSAANGKLTLEDLDTRDLRYDVAKDEAWLPALAEGLRDLSRSNSRFRGKAVFILPGYQLLIKPIKVPHVDTAKQAQIIGFEAQNNIPFPLNDAVWGSQVIADDGIETEVLLAAQKAEAANRFCGLMATIGFQPISLQPSSLLDFNAYKFVHSADAEDTLMINVGARSTNLTFVSPAGLYIRNINLGGNALTQSLADGMGKSFTIVEDLKVSFYSGTTTFEAEDPAVAAMQARAQDFMKRLSQQVTQSIIAYRRATNRAAPQHILLTGRGSLLDGLPEFLSESQKVSVDYFNPGTVVKSGSRLGKGVMEQYYYQISECVGEAARLVKPDAMGINLLPPVIRARMQFNKQKPFLVLAAVLLALAPLPMIYKFYTQKNVAAIEKKSWDTRATDLNNLYQNLQKQSDEATATRKKIADLESLMNSRFNWIQFFQKLQDALVDIKDVWLDNLSVEREVIVPATPAPGAPGSTLKGAAVAADAPAGPTTSYKLNVKGRLLLRLDNPDAPVTEAVRSKAAERLTDLQNRLLSIPFVKGIDQTVGSTKIDFKTDPRMAGFDFTLIINPENPL
jgi:type IV pilus assembly protein PilM